MKNKKIERFNALFGRLKETASAMLLDIGDPALILERARQKPRVLVVGEFNAGKSSLINALLGETLLPTGVTPTTSLVTTIEKGPFKLDIKAIGQKDAVKIQPGKDAGAIGYGIPDLGFDWDGYRKLLTDPKNIDQIEQIRITHPAVPESIVVIDTPGINDLSKSRAEIVYGLIPSADIILFVISATKPFAETERKFIEEKLLTNDLKKIVFVVNRLDEIDEHERQELLDETGKSILMAMNNAYEKVNKLMGNSLFQPLTSIDLFGSSAREFSNSGGGAPSKSIGFQTKGGGNGDFGAMNGNLWKHVLELATSDRESEMEGVLLHYLRRASMRIKRALESSAAADNSNRGQMLSRLTDSGKKLEKLRTMMLNAETRIREAESLLKGTLRQQIEKTMAELASTFRLQRDPATVNLRLKELYEYIVNRMKTTLDALYAELGREFDAILDEKMFVEQKQLSIQYDLSDFPHKAVSSMSMASIAAFFFGINIGIMAGVAYFAAQIISNKKSVKEYFMSATVSEDTLEKVKTELINRTEAEVEYAIDFVRQSIVQRIDSVQQDISHIVFSMTRKQPLNIEEIRKGVDALQPEINAFIIDEPAGKAGKG